MKNWNLTGKIKALIIVVMSIYSLLFPTIYTGFKGPVMFIIPFLFGIIITPVVARLNMMVAVKEIVKPSWNDNPIRISKPLTFFQFVAFYFLVTGLGTLIGSAIRYGILNYLALTTMSFGLGIIVGIWVTLLIEKRKNRA